MKTSSIYLFGAMISMLGFMLSAFFHLRTSSDLFVIMGFGFIISAVGMYWASLHYVMKDD